jgi:ankyrin repeat protein
MDYTGDYKFSDKEKKAVLGIIDLLIKNGARIDVQDKFGRTPLTHIVKEANEKNKQKVFDLVPELLSRGARIDIADSEGKTAADYARSGIAGLSDIVR